MTSTIALLLHLVVFEFNTCLGMFLSGSESSHLRYPQLSFCQNSSISLDFKTTASPEALLVYTDDLSRGRPNYLEISYDTSGHVTALVRDENRRKFRIGPYLLNDGRWHRVELRKVNSKIYLILDGIVTTAAYAYGESGTGSQLTGDELQLPATAGDQHRAGSYVYVGGLPAEIRENPGQISLPSAALKRSLNGYIRNVIYRNCTCQTARIRHVDGSGYVDYPPSKCDDGSRRCLKGCTCILADNENSYECDCSEKHCVDSIITHYYISFDRTSSDILLNMSDVTATMVATPYHHHHHHHLDSSAIIISTATTSNKMAMNKTDRFFFKHGVKNEALQLDDDTGHVRLSGVDHYSECFGDLSLCSKGYTIMAWLFVTVNCSSIREVSSIHRGGQSRSQERQQQESPEVVVMSSGAMWLEGQRHGLKMTWNPRSSQLVVAVNTTSGLASKVTTGRMTSHAWYHVTFTWFDLNARARLYIDGTLDDESTIVTTTSQLNQSVTRVLGDDVPSFLIGRDWTNRTEGTNQCRGGFYIDEFNYWSEEKSEVEILEFGPLFCRTISFDSLSQQSQSLPYFQGPFVLGTPTRVEGRIHGGILFSGSEDGLEYRPIMESKRSSYPGVMADGSTQRISGKTNTTMCFNNLDLCQHGLTVSIWLMIASLPLNSSSSSSSSSSSRQFFSSTSENESTMTTREILSTGCLLVWLRGGKLLARAMKDTTHIEASTKELLPEDTWLFVEASWDGKYLSLYLNRKQVALAKWWQVSIGDRIYPKRSVTFGRSDVSQSEAEVQLNFFDEVLKMSGSSLKVTKTKGRQTTTYHLILDHAQLCYGNRETLLRTGVIKRGVPTNILLELDNIFEGGRLHSSNPNFLATVSRDAITVPGKVNNATRLDDKQYIEIRPLVGGLATSCLTDFSNCRHGFYLSSWVKFRDFTPSKFVFVSNRNILIEYSKESGGPPLAGSLAKSKREIRAPKGTMTVNFTLLDKKWAGRVNGLKVDSWIFIEISWSPISGLEIYIDRLLKSRISETRELSGNPGLPTVSESESLFFGKHGQDIKNSKLLLDETEIWFADRATLLAFNHITRGNISQVLVSFESNSTTSSGDYQTTEFSIVPVLYGDAEIIEDEERSGTGLSLCDNSNEGYAYLGSYESTCLGNLHFCHHGLTMTLLLKLRKPGRRGYLLSTDGYFIELLESGRVYVQLETDERIWRAESSISLKVDKWYRLSISWESEKGLSVFVDKERRAYDPVGYKMPDDYRKLRMQNGERTFSMYIGKVTRRFHATSDARGDEGTCPNVKVNQVEFWHASRNMVLAFGSFEDDINGLRLNMQKIENDILVYRSHAAYVFGSPRLVDGYRGSGLLLNGLNQYVDLGRDVICKSYLENCVKGITVRFKMKPLELMNMTYFISTPLVDVFYNRGLFICEVRNRTKQWTLYADHIALNSWNEIDISWRADKGAILLINNSRIVQDSKPTTNEQDHDPTKKFLVGRADTDMSFESYAHAIFDDVEFWEGDLETLKKFGHLKNDDYEDLPVRKDRKRPRPSESHLPPEMSSSSKHPGKKVRQQTKQHTAVPAIFKPYHRKMLTFDGRSFVEFFVDLFPLDDLVQLQDWKAKVDEGIYQFEGSDLGGEGLPPHYLGKPENLTDPSEQLLVKFKTSDANGLLFYSGTSEKNVYLSIKSGFPLLVVNYNLNNSEKFRPTLVGQRLDDNEWHEILITRQHNRITINVDGIDHPRELASVIGFMEDGKFLMGGEENIRKLTSYLMRNNFRGSIDKMTFINDSLPNGLNLIDLVFVKPTRPYLKIHGNVAGEPSADLTSREPVVVTFQGSSPTYIKLPRWKVETVYDDDDSGGTVKIHRPNPVAGVSPKHKPFVEFHFRTFDADSFLLYSGGKPGHTDFITLEISDGVLWIVFDPGSGQLSRFVFGKEGENYVSDGNPHFVKIELVVQTIKLILDKVERTHSIPFESSPFYHMGTFTYLGGVDNLERLPWHVWNRERKEQFFVGCVWNVRFTGGTASLQRKQEHGQRTPRPHSKEYYYDRDGDYESVLNLPQLALEQGAETVLKGCKLRPSECLHQPCQRGRCQSQWNGYQCDCAGTDHTGPNCGQEAQKMAFAGESLIHLRFDGIHTRHRNDITVRFKTMETGGLLFKTRIKTSDDSIEAFVDEGRLWIGVKFGEQMPMFPMLCKCGGKMIISDNQWYTLNILRKAASLTVWVDDCPRNEAEIQGEGFAFDMEEISIGGLEWSSNNASHERQYEYFVGYLQNFIFDGLKLLENLELTGSRKVQANHSPGRPSRPSPRNATHGPADDTGGMIQRGFAIVVNTAEAASDERLVPSRPITIKNAVLEIPAAGGIPANISFLFRFPMKNASQLLFYRRDLRSESGIFLSLEILRSRVRFSGNMGKGLGEIMIKRKLRSREWHSLRLQQSTTLNRFQLLLNYDHNTTYDDDDDDEDVDDDYYIDYSFSYNNDTGDTKADAGIYNLNFQRSTKPIHFENKFYLGGFNQSLEPLLEKGHLKTRDFFQGCLASLYINGYPVNLQELAMRAETSRLGYMEERCSDDFMTHCKPDTCKNGGKCLEMRKGSTCNCQLTSHQGDRCEQEARGFHFGSTGSKGLFWIKMAEPSDDHNDVIALAMMTWQKDSTLLRIDSQSSSDFLEARLINGQLQMLGSLGGEELSVTTNQEEGAGLGDLNLHRVLVRRRGNFVQLFINDSLVNEHPGDDPKRNFKERIDVKVGGDIDHEGSIIGAFKGIIAGLHVNGMSLIEMYISNWPNYENITMETKGDVIVASHPFRVVSPEKLPETSKEKSEQQIQHQHQQQPAQVATESAKVDDPPEGVNGGEEKQVNKSGERKRKEIPGYLGGGGVGWKSRRTESGMLDGISLVLIPGGLSGAGINTRIHVPTDDILAEGQQQHPGHRQRRIIRNGVVIQEDVEGPRAIAVTGALLVTLLAVSSIIWAFYRFKPGRLFKKRSKVNKFEGVISRGQSSFIRARLDNSSPHLGNAEARGRTEIALVDSNNKLVQTYLKGLCTEDVPLGSGFCLTSRAAPLPPSSATTPDTPKTPSSLLSPNYYHSSSSTSPHILFTTSVSGSTVAGMIATREHVSRPTQTDLTYKGLATKKDETGPRMRMSESPLPGSSASDQHRDDESVLETTPVLTSKSQVLEDKRATVVVTPLEGRATSGSFIARKMSELVRKADDLDFSRFRLKSPSRHEPATSTTPATMTATANPFIPSCLTSPHEEVILRKAQTGPEGLNWKTPMTSDSSSFEAPSSTPYDMSASTTSLGSEWSQYSGLTADTEENVECLVLSRSGELLVTGSVGETPMVWDAKTTSRIRSLRGKGLNAIDLHLTSDDSLLVGGVPAADVTGSDVESGSEWNDDVVEGRSKILQIWDFTSGHPFDMPPSSLTPYNVSSLLDSSDHLYESHRLLMASFQAEIASVLFIMYDLHGNEPTFKKYAATPLRNQRAAALERLVVSGDARYASAILVFDPEARNPDAGKRLKRPERMASCILISCCIDGDPNEGDANDEESFISFEAHHKATCALAGSHLALTVTWRHEAVVWNMATGSIVQRTDLKAEVNNASKGFSGICCAESSVYSDNMVILASTDGWIGKLDVRDGHLEGERNAHKQKVTSLKFASNDQIFLTSSKDGTIKIWVTETFEPITSLENGSPVLHFETTLNGKVVAALSRELVKPGWAGFLKKQNRQTPKKRFLLFRAN